MDISIWTEKYRPRLLKDVIDQRHVVERLKSFVKEGRVPHMIFAGPPGTGKTCCAIAVARELFGDGWQQNFQETNASDMRGIDVIRTRIKNFSRMKPIGASFKIIFLDEADALTSDAQNALRRLMEMYSEVTRFILSCVGPETKIVLPGEVEMTVANFERKFNNGVLSVKERSLRIENDVVLGYMKQNPVISGKKTIRLTTMTGRKLDITDDHPLLTEKGWSKAGNLNVGEKIAVYPYLEGTEYPDDDSIIINKDDIKGRIQNYEIEKYHSSPPRYRNLPNVKKEKIEKKVHELNCKLKEGLTAQEKNIYDIISSCTLMSREDISKRIGLSRIGTNYHLSSLVRKGWIKRVVDSNNSKIHRFVIEKEGGCQIRNKMDIKNAIEKDFKIKISYCTVKNIIAGFKNCRYGIGLIINDLENKGLLPLRYTDKRIGTISRLSGFILGDGHITKNHQRLIFTTDKKSLLEIRRDVIGLGYKPSKIFSKGVNGEINGRKFNGMTTWFHVDSKPLCWLFESLGVITGDKCIQEFHVPNWILSGPRYIKREFLRGLFGSEMSTPNCRKRNFEAILFTQNKSLKLVKSGKAFANQIITVLEEFDVKSKLKIRKLGKEFARKNGEEMCEISVMLMANNQNMLKFFKHIGYAYSVLKEKVGRWSAEYLRHKLHVIELREKMADRVLLALRSGHLPTNIARKCHCTFDFVADRRDGKEVHLCRNFPAFSDWKSEHVIRNSDFVWNEIESVEEIELEDVRDIMCMNNHNFIANGIVSHNCNYSSNIISPIQSRAVVFRFKSLAKENVFEYMERVVKGEKLKIDKEALEALYEASEGDMRKATNVLQASAVLGKKITKDIIYEVAAQAEPKEVIGMMNHALNGKFTDAREILKELLLKRGISGQDIIKEISNQLYKLDISDNAKIDLVEKVGESEFRINQGGNEQIQIEALLAKFSLYSKTEQ